MIGAEIAAALPQLRAEAESLMRDTCMITRIDPDGTPVFNSDTGLYVDPLPLTVYTGKCRVKGNARFDHVVQAGGQPVTLYRFAVSVPVGSITFKVDDIVHVTASALDPAMVGLNLRVRQPEFGSQITARRLGCEENAG